MSDMSQYFVQTDGLARIPTLLTEIGGELRNVQPLLNASAAAQASAPILASALAEFSVTLSTFVDTNASDIQDDAARVGQAMGSYLSADQSVVETSLQLCRPTDSFRSQNP